MLDPYFIDTDDLKEEGLINNNVEDSILSPLIIRAQRAIVRPIVGTSLYKRLVAGVNATDLNANELILMNDYIVPLLVVSVDRMSINATTYQIRNKTTGKAVDPNIQPVSQEENLRLDSDLRLSIKVERDTLIGYLLDNCDLYPEYDSGECNNENIQPTKTKGGYENFFML